MVGLIFFLSIPIPGFIPEDRFAWNGPLRLSFTDRRKRPGHGRQTSTRIILGIIFSFYSDSGFCAVRPVRLDRSVKAFVDFIGSSPARKNKRFCFSLAYSKNSLTGGTPHFVRQTPPVGRSENLTGPSFLLQWSSGIKPFISRQS